MNDYLGSMAFPIPDNTVQFVQALDGSMKIRITDTTEWVANGIALSTLEIFVGVTSPDGNVFHPINLSFPDITPSVSRSVEFTCPNDALGNPQTGNYYVQMYCTSNDGFIITEFDTGLVLNVLCADYPTLCIQDVPDCIYMFLTVRDVTPWTTNGFTVDSRTFTLYYPQGSGPSPIVTVSDTITTPDLWTGGAYTAVLEVTVTNGNYTTSLVSRKNFEANCMSGADLCTLVCVLNKVQLQTESRNLTVSADAEARYAQMVDLMTHITAAAKCGMGTQLDNLLDDFYTLGGATRNCDCGCADSSGPTVLVPIHPGGGGSGSVVQIIVAAGPGIEVSYNSGTATYTVAMSAANVALLASLYNTVVDAGTGITVTPVPVGIVTTYTVSVTDPVPDSIKWSQNFIPSLGLPGSTMGPITIVGTTFSNGVTISDLGGNFYSLTGFFSGSPTAFQAKMEIRSRDVTPAFPTLRYNRIIDVQQFFTPYGSSTTSIVFGFVDSGLEARDLVWFSTYLSSFDVDFSIEKID
jgi:hypothetical protein